MYTKGVDGSKKYEQRSLRKVYVLLTAPHLVLIQSYNPFCVACKAKRHIGITLFGLCLCVRLLVTLFGSHASLFLRRHMHFLKCCHSGWTICLISLLNWMYLFEQNKCYDCEGCWSDGASVGWWTATVIKSAFIVSIFLIISTCHDLWYLSYCPERSHSSVT